VPEKCIDEEPNLAAVRFEMETRGGGGRLVRTRWGVDHRLELFGNVVIRRRCLLRRQCQVLGDKACYLSLDVVPFFPFVLVDFLNYDRAREHPPLVHRDPHKVSNCELAAVGGVEHHATPPSAAKRSSASASGLQARPYESRSKARRKVSNGQPNWNASDAATAASLTFTSDCDEGFVPLRKISASSPLSNSGAVLHVNRNP
jgi:hypothetical protein